VTPMEPDNSADPIDQRTGQLYVGKDWGHGMTCTCEPCLDKTTSDLVEAGILDITGVSEGGALLLEGLNEDEK
jgi:hypothetical protein